MGTILPVFFIIMSVDLELKQAFQELQSKISQTNQHMQISDAQIETSKRQNRQIELQKVQFEQIPSEVKVFKSVGRMFLLSDVTNIQKENDTKIKALESKKKHLEKSIQDSKNGLNELIA